MKNICLFVILPALLISRPVLAQNKPDNSKIDIMLVRGDFKKVIDTCNLILTVDSLNSEIYYKQGLAYQNLMLDDKSFDCFLKAATFAPDNNIFNFTLAKSYISRGKTGRAKPILEKLYAADTLNWPYAFYLTNLYMQEEKYDESIKIYDRFYMLDSTNYVILDKIGFASLKNRDFEKAIDMYEHSLAINPKNINAIKNLAYLNARTFSVNTAIKLLTTGIEIDSSDMDLYARRATINFSIYNYQKSLEDYLKILSAGDSSAFNLKRAGLSYANLTKTNEAVFFLQKAHDKDTSDIETLSNLALNLWHIKDYRNSIVYYKTLIKTLNPVIAQVGLYNLLLAGVLKDDDQVVDAINAYLKSQEFRSDASVIMIVANLYDERLKDYPKAIRYYELYLNKIKNTKDQYDSDYSDSVRKRIEALKTLQKSKK
jgi:tetratricopeptide (TPR) repeat protein